MNDLDFAYADVIVDKAIATYTDEEKDSIMKELEEKGYGYPALMQEYLERSDSFPVRKKDLELQIRTVIIATSLINLINSSASIVVSESTHSVFYIAAGLIGAVCSAIIGRKYIDISRKNLNTFVGEMHKNRFRQAEVRRMLSAYEESIY